MLNVAILLDLDNIKPQLGTVEKICESYGKIVTRWAFSNTPAVLTAYGSAFRNFNYRFELTPGLDPVPQEVDNLISKTAKEITENDKLAINLVAIVSNDNGYANLFTELKPKGVQSLVIGFGSQIGNQLRETADYVEVLKQEMRPTYVGIDLGTTNTVIGIANWNLMRKEWKANALPVAITDERKSLYQSEIIPSAVRFTSEENAEIGGHIKSNAYAFRDQTILAWKHNMGESVEGKPFYFELTSGKVLPEQAASQVLKFARSKLAEKYEIQGVVITHPASYEADAIEATRQAAILAGWEKDEIIPLSEPEAALYDFLYRMQQGEIPQPFDVTQPANVLVYDLGGGTLDVTLHQVQWNQNANQFLIQNIAIGSRTRIGGETVDQAIAQYVIKNSPYCKNLSTAEYTKLSYELPLYAEKFKKIWGSEYLSTPDKENFQYSFQGSFLDNQLPLRYYISRQRMREILAPLLCEDLNLDFLANLDTKTAFDHSPFTDRLNTLVVPILEVFLKAKESTGNLPNIDAVLLNGGMTYFPPIRERLIELLGNVPILDEGNPDLAVARGASLYAAGALKPGEGVNPTNIYLEVAENGNPQLRLLMAQGQKYPYKTLLKGFRLPDADQGSISFKIWVGMGKTLGNNTTLQRLREVPLKKLYATNLQPGCLLDLQIEYTFDERLILTLIAENGAQAEIEVKQDHLETYSEPTSSPSETATLSIPSISRFRTTEEPEHNVSISFEKWEGLANNLNREWNNGTYQQQLRDLGRQSATASNRTQIIRGLLTWLERGNLSNSHLVKVKTIVAVRSLTVIFQKIDSEEPSYSRLEKQFQEWVRQQFCQGFPRLHNDLIISIVNVPGRLFWAGFEKHLIQNFQSYQHQAMSHIYLDALGKCGSAAEPTLKLLKRTLKNNRHLGVRMKATWALGRLVSPGQPKRWQTNIKQAEASANLVLDELCYSATEPQLAMDLLGCLSHCLAWQSVENPLSERTTSRVKHLSTSELPVENYLYSYPQIESIFYERLNLLPKFLEPKQASAEELEQMNKFLLESVKD